MSGGVQAWLTAAVDNKAVEKAIVLAGSLRRVKTAKKLAVFTTLEVSKELREKLKDAFDLVVLLDGDIPSSMSLEDCAKVQGFSLMVFNKCVYVSPRALVLKNCDELFDKYATFAACGDGKEVDSDVYVFTPSLDQSRALEKVVSYVGSAGDRLKGTFARYFNLWMQNHIAHSERLPGKYNLRMDLNNYTNKSLEVDITIANFVGPHPLELPGGILSSKFTEFGAIEKYAVERCLQIHAEGTTINGIPTANLGNLEHYENEPIAIVGMSFRLPGGNNIDEFWDLLINGKEAIQLVPPFRWNKEHTSVVCKNRNFQAGFLNMPIDEFDAKFFGISPKESIFLDPQQRLLHEVSWEAFEDAMIDPLALQGSQTGVFVGSWIHDYKDIAVKCTDKDFFRIYMGNSIATEAARLSHFYGTTGPSIATESGCSSAIVALHMACKSLRNRETSLALTGGVNLLLHPQDLSQLSFVVAPDGRCKTFSDKADGFGRAEACAVLVLKRYSDAIKNEDNIWGLIRGSAVTQEGVSKSLGTPTVHCESLAMKLALKDANVHPRDVSFVEAHGTGTAVGDPMEVSAITQAYGVGRQEPLIIGSVKTNVGHTESASGLTGIIKVLISMKNEMIPPHINLETINPDINLDAIPARIPMEAVPWTREENKPRIAGVSSFGISGTDGHALIEEPPLMLTQKINFQQERPLHIMKFSAKCSESLDEILAKYESIFTEKAENFNEKDFANMAYSANFGRSTFNHRAVLVASDFSQAAKIIRDKSYKYEDVQSNGSQLVFLFTGQGSQYHNMGATLYKTSPVFKENFDICNDVLEKRYGISIKDVLWSKSGDENELSRTLYSQTSIFCIEFCLFKLWESWGVKPDYVLGHSLGEFAAAVAAGALTFDDALMLVAERSRLIDSLPRGKMLVIKADKKTVQQAISKYTESHPQFWVDYAALNSAEQTVVAGDPELIEEFAAYVTKQQLKSIVLAATSAFHSRHMDPILQKYRTAALTTKQPQINEQEQLPKYISGMDGKIMEIAEMDADYWVRHTREKVNFVDACKVIRSEGCTLFMEMGPHPVLSALVMANSDGQSITCLPSLRRKEGEWITLLDSLSKLFLSGWKGEIDWKGYDQFYMRQRVTLPFYQFNRKPVWIKIRPGLPDLHPLVGKVVPNASEVSVFEQDMSLKKADFAQDHIIGNTVVFPGAGFLEMCLIGGHSCVQGFCDTLMAPRRPVVLKNLKIKTPMALLENQLCILQTVVALDDKDEAEMGYNVTINRLTDVDSPDQWVQHASAKFLPVAPALPSEVVTLNVKEMQQSWKKTDSSDFYESLPDVGLRFGPKFQSLQTGWKSDDGILLRVKMPENIAESYIMHPVVADAMIQAAMLWSSQEQLKKKLQVPVQIGEFIWLDSSKNEGRYIFCSTLKNGNITYCLLVDDVGKPLAYMSSIEFASTTVKLVEGMIYQQNAAMPHLWEEIWKPTVGPLQKSMENKSYPQISDEFAKDIASFNKLDDDEEEYYDISCKQTLYYILNSLYKLGWNPYEGDIFTVEGIIAQLGIQECYSHYLRFFMRTLSEFKMIETNPSSNNISTYRISKSLPPMEEVSEFIRQTEMCHFADRLGLRLMKELGQNLSSLFLGQSQPLQYLFPSDPAKPTAHQFYDSVGPFTLNVVKNLNNKHFIPHYKNCIKETLEKYNTEEKPILKILEIGAGTGSFTTEYLKILREAEFEIEYYYTDISAAFFGPAEKVLAEHKKYIVFKKFNMDDDAFEQGYCPEYFDIIVGLEVMHVAKDLRATLQRLRCLLKPHGSLQFIETTHQCPRITFIFGVLEGYWQFQDHDLRPDHITLTGEKWTKTLKECGFATAECYSAYNKVHGYICAQASNENVGKLSVINSMKNPKKSWVIFSDNSTFSKNLTKRIEGVHRKVVVVLKPNEISEKNIKTLVLNSIFAAGEDEHQLEGVLYLWGLDNDTRDQAEISLPFMSLCQEVVRMEKLPRMIVVTVGIYPTNGTDISHPSPGSLIGLARSVSNEHSTLKMCHLDLSPMAPMLEQVDETFYNLWVENNGMYAFRDRKRFTARMTAFKNLDEYLSLPNGCDRYQLVLPSSRLISDLEYTYLDQYVLGDNDVEVQVKAMALNFRDVFCVLKPLKAFEDFNSVGLDFAGVVIRAGPAVTKVKLGDRVIGMNIAPNLSLPSHIRMDEKLIARLPDDLTFNEGATLPAVFSTAVYCLLNVAKMKRGETLLIHTASGGVGLCAIQLAKKVGVNIIATAGSTRKRNFLRNLGIEHIFNSRTTDFGKQILEVTNGKGVDIVLNSITGPGFKEASLGALTQNGRFIEMSKLSVWEEDEVKKMRPDVFYQIVDLTVLPKKDYEELTDTLTEFLETSIVNPLPYERFDALNIRGALYHLQKAKHIGKIICVMPEVKLEKSKVTVTTPLFNEISTYLVTGGLGGIGFEMVKWMLDNGAKHIAIASRSSPKPEIANLINIWNKSGKHVEAFAVDIGNFSQCQQLFDKLKHPNFPKLRGVMHAAGVLQDATLENQSWDKFFATYNAKVRGSWNLHDLTKDMALEHFVFFSSIAATLGSPAQSNHCASNSFEDSLGHYRHSIGLPALSLNWGNWGEVGIATEVDLPGVRPLSTKQGLLAFKAMLTSQKNNVMILNIDSFGLLSQLIYNIKTYIADKRLLGEAKLQIAMTSDEFWAKVDASADEEEKLQVFKAFIKSTVKITLKMDEDEDFDDNTDFQVLGVDSLMMLEMKNGLQNVLGARMTLTVAQLKDCSSTATLARRLVDILQGESETIINFPTAEELCELIRSDSCLPENICPPVGATVKHITQIKTVLLTGVTGNLGPYLLRDISQRPGINKIYCLVRKIGKSSGFDRLQAKLQDMHVLHEIDMEKVECINGDITDDMFGMSEAEYNNLAMNVDAVFHSAVRSDHIEKYWKAPESRKVNIRTVNVLGTVRVLEFATTATLKHVYHASTLLTVTTLSQNNCLSEDWQDVSAFDNLAEINAGYPISKHISDMLMQEAMKRGVPVKVLRLPGIGGDSRTGRCSFEMNHFILRWLGYMRLGCMHDFPTPFTVLPVDQVSSLSLDIFMNPNAPSDIYNISMRGVGMEQTLIDAARDFGIHVEAIPFEKFVAKLKLEPDDSPLVHFRKMYEDDGLNYIELFDGPHIRAYVENCHDFFTSTKLLKLKPDYEAALDPIIVTMKRDLKYLKDLGIFEKFGIQVSSTV